MALTAPTLAVSIPSASAVEPVAPLAVENFGYPDAAKILSEQGITLKTGDGNIKLADCTSGAGLLRVRYTGDHETCFKATGATGYLSMEIPAVYAIMSDNHAVKATMSAGGTTSNVDLIKNQWKEVGTGNNQSESVLLDLVATDGTPTTVPAPELSAVGSITVGLAGRTGARGCTGTLVDPMWVLTSAGCFTDNPSTLTAGAPAVKSTFTLGTRATDIAQLMPRTDRDTVLARLAVPIYNITPAKLATTATSSGSTVKAVGYGRTTAAWWNGAHTTNQSVGAVTPTGIDLTPAAGAAPICAGDAGAPVLNTAGDIVGVVSRAWQAGCLGTPAAETRTGASAARVDDLATWATTAATGPYLLYNLATGKCADLPGYGPGTVDGPINQYTCDGSSTDNQLFYWDKHGTTADGYDQFTIRNAKDNLCFDVHGYDAVEAGAKVSEYTCDGTTADNQLFKRVPRADGGVWIVNVKSNLCLDVDGIRTGGNDARLTVYTGSDNDDHSWQQR